MSSYMTKLEFLPEPYMLFRLGKLSRICCLFCIEFCQTLLTLMRDLSCSTNQDHVHTTHICTTLTLGVGANTCLPSRSTQKCSTPTLGVNTKNMLDRFSIHQINASSSCCYLSKVWETLLMVVNMLYKPST